MNKYTSIDGFFSGNLKVTNNFKYNKNYLYTPKGMGNSISRLPYTKKTNLISINKEQINFNINKKKKILTANGNSTIREIHNFLIKNKFYCKYFPSYPEVTIGSCIASATHGNTPKFGILSDFVKELTLYNPNFGIKKLSKKKNKKLYDLTIGGFGLTGIITEVKIKIFSLKNTLIKSNFIQFNNLYTAYLFLKNSKYSFHQNSILINYSDKHIFNGRIFFGNLTKEKTSKKHLKKRQIPKIRLGIFKFEVLKNLIIKLFFFLELIYNKIYKIKHINDFIFTSNRNIIYFLLMPKKFIEYQNIIPDNYVKKYLFNFKNLISNIKPNITLMHLKYFNGKKKGFIFNSKGLSIAIHIVKDKNFNKFTKALLKLDHKFKATINLYKNSLINRKIVKNFYPRYYSFFNREIKKINKNQKFINSIFH